MVKEYKQIPVRESNLAGTNKLKLIFLGLVTGLFSGMLAVAYRLVLAELDTIRDSIYNMPFSINYLWMFLAAFVFGVIVVQLLKWAPLSGGSGIPQIRGELLGRLSMNPGPTLISKFLGGSLANFIGLSLGREGPSIQLGGVTGKIVGKLFKTDKLTSNYLITAGASAGLSAAFNAPIAGTLFTLEEVYGSFSHYLLLPSIIASITANFVSFIFAGKIHSFSFRVNQTIDMNDIGWVALVGLIAGLVGILFNHFMEWTRRFFAWTRLKPIYLVPLIFMLTVVVGLFSPELLGGGHHLVEHMVVGPISVGMLVFWLIGKLVFTSISYNSGVQGGIFLPVLVLGAISGLLVYHISGLEPVYMVNFIILGMSAVMTAVVRAPIMSIVLVMEMTGSFTHLIMLSFASIIAFIVGEITRTEPIYETLYNNLIQRLTPQKVEESELIVSTFTIGPESPLKNTLISDLNLPTNLLIVEINREGLNLLPKADESIKTLDTVMVLHNVLDTELVHNYFTHED